MVIAKAYEGKCARQMLVGLVCAIFALAKRPGRHPLNLRIMKPPTRMFQTEWDPSSEHGISNNP
jgi:hypothetical protein